MPIWERNPYQQQDASAWLNNASGISPLGASSDPLTPGRNDGPDDPPESGAPENSADGGFDLFDVDWGAQDFDPDLERMGKMYQDLYGSEPPSSLYQPAQVNYDPLRNALRQASQAEQEAIQQAQNDQQERLEKRQFQTLWTALGPEVFNAFSGAGVNTGFERSLALQQKAEQRAAQLDRELGLREAEQTREDLTRRAQLQIEEQQTNAQRERKAARQQYEDERARQQALLEGYAGLQQAQSERDAAEAELQQEAQQAQREYQTDLRQDTIDLISELDDDPQLAPQVAAQIQALNPEWSDQQVKARVGQMLRASQQGTLNADSEGGALVQGSAQNPVSLVDNLVSSTLSLKEEYDQTDNLSPGWEGRDRTRPASSTASGRQGDYLRDLEGKRQVLVYQLGRAANEAEQRAYDLQKAGVQVPAEITNEIASLNTAREKLKQIIVEEGADADNVEKALKPVRSAVATLAGTQSQQGDALRSNPATAPYIAAYEGAGGAQARTASSEEEGDEASSADPVRDLLSEVENDPALRDALGMGQDETRSRESAAQGAEEVVASYEARVGQPIDRVVLSEERLRTMDSQEIESVKDRVRTGNAVVVMGASMEDAGPDDVLASPEAIETAYRPLRNQHLRETTGSDFTSEAIGAVGDQLKQGSAKMAERRLRQYGVNVQPGDTAEVVQKPNGSFLVQIIEPGSKRPRTTFSVPDAQTARRIRDQDVPLAAQAQD